MFYIFQFFCYFIAAGSGSGIRIPNADPDTDPGWPSKCGSMRIRIRNTAQNATNP